LTIFGQPKGREIDERSGCGSLCAVDREFDRPAMLEFGERNPTRLKQTAERGACEPEEPHGGEALAILRDGAPPVAPDFLIAEVCNAAWRSARLGRISQAQLGEIAANLPLFFDALRKCDLVGAARRGYCRSARPSALQLSLFGSRRGGAG
jgi:hypothetical protein